MFLGLNSKNVCVHVIEKGKKREREGEEREERENIPWVGTHADLSISNISSKSLMLTCSKAFSVVKKKQNMLRWSKTFLVAKPNMF